MTHIGLRLLRVHKDTTHNNLTAALSILKAANPATQSWKQAGQSRRHPDDLMQVIGVDREGKTLTEIVLEKTALSRAMNILGFGGATGDAQLNPGVELGTIAHILNTQTIIRRGQVSNQKPGDFEGLIARFSNPARTGQPVIQEKMGISPKSDIPLESIGACLTLLGVDYAIEEGANIAPHALITDADSIMKVLQCTEYDHYPQAAEVPPSGNAKPSPPLGGGFRLGYHPL